MALPAHWRDQKSLWKVLWWATSKTTLSSDNGNLNGFHLQDPLGDGDTATSDGIFIYAPGGMDVAVGDAVRVRGAVSEFNGMTEITATQIWAVLSGNSIAQPRRIVSASDQL